jgi:hypothetical protein
MDIEISHTPSALSATIFIAALWVLPIGAFVLRKRLRDVQGIALVFKGLLFSVAVPLTLIALLVTVPLLLFGVRESFDNLALLWRAMR